MKLADLAKRPQLVEITLDDPETLEEFGEVITFWTWDRQPMDVFMKLANVDATNATTVVEAVRHLILDEAGAPVLKDDIVLPTKIMMRVITRVVENLGKF